MCQKHHKPTGLHASDYAAGEEYKKRMRARVKVKIKKEQKDETNN